MAKEKKRKEPIFSTDFCFSSNSNEHLQILVLIRILSIPFQNYPTTTFPPKQTQKKKNNPTIKQQKKIPTF